MNTVWTQRLTNLNDVLADLYPTNVESRRLAVGAGLKPAFIKFHDAAIVNWFNILEEAQRRQRVDAILVAALKDYPDNEILIAIAREEPPAVKGPDLATNLRWRGTASAAHFEKITGAQSTLLPISFLEVGLACARAVARIVRGDGGSGTGFLFGSGLLLTNHHVLASAEEAAAARAQFNCQQLSTGVDAPIDSYELDPETCFATSEDNDWTAVGVRGDAATTWGVLALNTATPKMDDFVNIIQHPGGGPKHVALYHNTVVYADDDVLQYLTDTLPGSSGSPVFDSNWKVVALHHSGGLIREPGSKRFVYRNEGININVVRRELLAGGVELS